MTRDDNSPTYTFAAPISPRVTLEIGAAFLRKGDTMQKCKCGHPLWRGQIFGDRCEDCWVEAQPKTREPNGIPYLAGLGGRRTIDTGADPDLADLLAGRGLVVL